MGGKGQGITSPRLSMDPQVQIPVLCAPVDSCGPFSAALPASMRPCDARLCACMARYDYGLT